MNINQLADDFFNLLLSYINDFLSINQVSIRQNNKKDLQLLMVHVEKTLPDYINNSVEKVYHISSILKHNEEFYNLLFCLLKLQMKKTSIFPKRANLHDFTLEMFQEYLTLETEIKENSLKLREKISQYSPIYFYIAHEDFLSTEVIWNLIRNNQYDGTYGTPLMLKKFRLIEEIQNTAIKEMLGNSNNMVQKKG